MFKKVQIDFHQRNYFKNVVNYIILLRLYFSFFTFCNSGVNYCIMDILLKRYYVQ